MVLQQIMIQIQKKEIMDFKEFRKNIEVIIVNYQNQNIKHFTFFYLTSHKIFWMSHLLKQLFHVHEPKYCSFEVNNDFNI